MPGLGDPADLYSAVPRLADDYRRGHGAGRSDLAKTRLFESILACFARLAERSAIVLVFEDLQWADSASAELVSFLA